MTKKQPTLAELSAQIDVLESSIKTGIMDLIEQMKKAMAKQGDLKSDVSNLGQIATAAAQANPMVQESIGRLRYLCAAMEAVVRTTGAKIVLPSGSPVETK